VSYLTINNIKISGVAACVSRLHAQESRERLQEMKNKVIEIIAEVLHVVPEKVTPELSIGDIPEWSSMAQMGVISTLEQRLGIEIPIEDLFDLTNVQALIDEVEKLHEP